MLYDFHGYCTQLGMSHPWMAKAARFAKSKPDYYGFFRLRPHQKFWLRKPLALAVGEE